MSPQAVNPNIATNPNLPAMTPHEIIMDARSNRGMSRDEVFEIARAQYDEVFEDYAQSSANLRNSEGFGGMPGRLGTVLNNLNRVAYHGLGSTEPTKRETAINEHAEKAEQYHLVLDDLTDVLREQGRGKNPNRTRQATHEERVELRLNALLKLETRIDEIRAEATGRRDQKTGKIERNPFQRVGQWVAETWLKHNRGVKTALVAVPAAVVGAGIGLGAAAVAAPAIAVVGAGIGAAVAGRAIGRGIAKTVNKYALSTETGQKARGPVVLDRLASMEAEATAGLEKARRNHRAFDPKKIDVFKATEEMTTAQVKANARRRTIAGRVGGIAAGVGFSGVSIVHGAATAAAAGHNTVSTHATALHQNMGDTVQHLTNHAANSAPNVAHPVSSAINPNEYPWDVAHQLQMAHSTNFAGTPMDMIKHYIQIHNSIPGAEQYTLHTLPNGKTEIARMVHGVISSLPHTEQAAFNNLMIHGSSAQQQVVASQRLAQALATR